MTIDRAIEMCEYNLSFNDGEYKQIAEWLEELKAYKENEFDVLKEDGQLLYKQGISDGYNKAIDKMKTIVKKHENTEKVQTVREICGNRRYYRAISVSKFCRLADKLKEDDNTKSEKCKYWNEEHEDCTLNTDAIYDNAIDDFVKRIDEQMPIDICDGAEALYYVDEIAEQLKESVKDE